MFCRSCGCDCVSEEDIACSKCFMEIGTGFNYCSKCGNHTENTTAFCSVCGTALNSENENNAVITNTYCRSCGYGSVSEDDSACAECGAEKGTGFKYCSGCGNNTDGTMAFCSACGTALDVEEQSVENKTPIKITFAKVFEIIGFFIPCIGFSADYFYEGIIVIIVAVIVEFIGLGLAIAGRIELKKAGLPAKKANAVIISIITCILIVGVFDTVSLFIFIRTNGEILL